MKAKHFPLLSLVCALLLTMAWTPLGHSQSGHPDTSLNGHTWHIQRVDTPRFFQEMTDRSLRLDAQNHPHIAYGGDFLYYAWYDGTQWHSEIVDDSGGVGRYASLALDGDGNPRISYFDWTNEDLKYARWTGSGWHIQTVDSAGWVGWYTSLALDADGKPHISYYDDTNDDLKYAWGEIVALKLIYLPLVLKGR